MKVRKAVIPAAGLGDTVPSSHKGFGKGNVPNY